jgi:hypothetical protein
MEEEEEKFFCDDCQDKVGKALGWGYDMWNVRTEDVYATLCEGCKSAVKAEIKAELGY